MRYLGGKARISKQLTSYLKSIRKPNQVFVDGMVGGGSIIRKMDCPRIAADVCPYLISFYKALKIGWLPPFHVTEEDYRHCKELVKQKIVSPKIAFILYFCSFGGKWCGGFARDKKTNRDFSNEAYKDSIRLIRGQYNDSTKLSTSIKNVDFYCLDYEELLKRIPKNSLVYFDPPYANTTKYKNKFDHDRFWRIVRTFSSLHDIYVSEYVAPNDFECVWSCERKTNLNTKTGTKADRVEKLFRYKGN